MKVKELREILNNVDKKLDDKEVIIGGYINGAYIKSVELKNAFQIVIASPDVPFNYCFSFHDFCKGCNEFDINITEIKDIKGQRDIMFSCDHFRRCERLKKDIENSAIDK